MSKHLAIEAVDELETWLVQRVDEQTFKLSTDQIKRYLEIIRNELQSHTSN